MDQMTELLRESSARHCHLCPRQVIGVRMGLRAAREFGLALPQTDKRLLTLVETDGCFADGVSVATGCWVGRRTLRVVDQGKVAATFVDTHTGQAIRMAARRSARTIAAEFAPEATSRWEGQLLGYQRMPDEALLDLCAVALTTSVEQILSRAGKLALCQVCGEEIINEREIVRGGQVLCRFCAGDGYYTVLSGAEACPALAGGVREAVEPAH
jgi:formylmethanofuran dehydrogenase subunit E